MRYAYDLEFLEDGETIELISLGMVAEDGREFYGVNRDFTWLRIAGRRWYAPWLWEVRHQWLLAYKGILALMLLAGVALTGCGTSGPNIGQPSAPDQPTPTSSSSLPEAQQARDAAVIPGYMVSIPKLGVTSNLVALGLNPDRTVQVPALDQPGQLGLYQPPSGAPRPGAVGPAAVFGHVNGRVDGRPVPGAFARLDTLVESDHIDVAMPDGLASRTVRFEVYRVQQVDKERFPTAQVYSDTRGPELRLITCGGEYDAANRNYLSNIIVYARVEQ